MSLLEDKRFFSFRGFMKSGTNWIGNLLNLHPQISCSGEFHWHLLYGRLQKNFRELDLMTDADVRAVLRKNLQTMIQQTMIDLAKESAIVIGDRTPHTIKPLVIKDAPQITIVRDARDVLVSRIFHLYNYPEVSKVFQRFPELMEYLEGFKQDRWFFRDHPEKLLVNETMVRESMQWWREHLESDQQIQASHPNLRVLTLRYEDFHDDIESKRRQMYEFLDVDPAAAADIPDQLRPLQEERPDEFNRKGAVGDWQNYILTDEVKSWVTEEAGEALQQFGYINSRQW